MLGTLGILLTFTQSSCGIYRFKDVSIPDSINVVKINQFTNTASYVNPALAPALTDKLKQKIVSQTKLRQTNGDDADWEINCKITSYSFSTAGISNQQVNTNRLNVGVHIEIRDTHTQKTEKYDVSTPFDYSGTLSLQQAEEGLLTQMLRDIPDAIFNRIFSNW
ncbi:hypothetical protein GCM10027051_25870 [Niabella terrae]